MLMKNKKKGASMVEYALLVSLIAIALIVTINLLSGGVGSVFSRVDSAIQ